MPWRRHRPDPVYARRYHPIRLGYVLSDRRVGVFLGRLRGRNWLPDIDKMDVTVSAPGIEP